MSGWDINPGGVNLIMFQVEAQAGEIQRALSGVGELVEGAATGGGSQDVADALGAFFTHHEENLTTIGLRIQAGIAGARSATAAYVAGDEQMSAICQTKAIEAASSGDFTFFGGTKVDVGNHG